MNVNQAIDLVREAFELMLLVSGPILLAGLVVGLCISLFQAVTQIQEQTLSFVPKIVAMAAAVILLAPWMSQMLLEFAQRMFGTMK